MTEIIEATSIDQWGHVKGDMNPANFGTRGMTISALKDSLIRLTGRLNHGNIPFETKHPLLLAAKHPLVIIFLEEAHINNYHEGTEYVRSVMQQYWMVGIRNALRSIKSKCVVCRKQITTGLYPCMASLPSERTAGNVFPFQNTGMDYFGPFEVKVMRRSLKRWCCLFLCLRALHIEVVPSLEAEACLAAITRFIRRRGKPHTIISDNGTIFVGAAKEIKQYLDD